VTHIKLSQMPAFKRAYKKLTPTEKEKVDEAIHALIKDPGIGEEKKGDLAGVFVYQFKSHHQLMLLAYEWNVHERLLLMLGVHENFYHDLKNKR